MESCSIEHVFIFNLKWKKIISSGQYNYSKEKWSEG